MITQYETITIDSIFGMQHSYIIRVSDGAFIPEDEANTDYQQYLAWVAEQPQPKAGK